jgi:hypothetical protein
MQELDLPIMGKVDLAAIDIIRDRERGVPRYNQFRRSLNMKPIKSFEDLTPDTEIVEKLKRLYNNDVEKLDLLVGSLAEAYRPTNFGFGETAFQIFIIQASRRLQGDRFYTRDYTRHIYTRRGLKWVDDASMTKVLLRHMPELEKYILHRLAVLHETIVAAYRDYDFKRVYASLLHFMNADLSAFYLDVRKDSLYCDPFTSSRRRACRTVLDQLFHCLTTWFAPILCFTTEEVWLSRFGGEMSSVHLMTFAAPPAEWRDDRLAEKWEKIRTVARSVYSARDITAERKVRTQLRDFEERGYGHYPVCIAKTQYSFSTDPGLTGAPSDHLVPVREVRLAAGAGFVVAVCGDIMTMPGLPREPAANRIGLDDQGRVEGLF